MILGVRTESEHRRGEIKSRTILPGILSFKMYQMHKKMFWEIFQFLCLPTVASNAETVFKFNTNG